MTTAWVFPGQGSQAIGMEGSLLETALGQERARTAEKILGWSVAEICHSDEETLSRTLYTQPCLFAIESILSDLCLEKGLSPDFVAGHSLGEYSALYAARVFDFESGLHLVRERARLMDAAAGGKMAALMKFDRPGLESAIVSMADVVIANDNSPEQVVISGTPEAIDAVLSQVKAKRALPLKVSGAFHSPLMENAARELATILESVPFHTATIPVVSNIDPDNPTTEATKLKEYLLQQMTGSVRWREIMLKFSTLGVTKAIEIGPGKVLTGLWKRTCPDVELQNIDAVSIDS
jgi:[acyl-carrier-protein] S-malonyltransferase